MHPPVESHKKYKLAVKKPSLLTLIVLISYGSIGAALFTPAIPSLMQVFGVSAYSAQFTVTAFLVGYSIGQLFYSPLAKRLGRKSALYIGISISLLGFVLSALSAPFESFSLLLCSRLISALGASVGLSLTFMIISDYFYESHARQVTAYTMLSFAVIPGIAIALGGFLVTYLGWVSCFYFLILYGLFALYLVTRLAETSLDREKDSFRCQKLFGDYKRDFKSPMLILFSTMIGATTALIYIFAATAPVIVIETMGIRPDTFGLLNLIPASGYFLGNFIAAQLAPHLAMQRVLKLGIALMGLGVVLLCIIFYGGWGNALLLFLTVFVVYLGIPLFYSNAAVLATFRSPDKPNASSIMSFLNIGGAVVGLLVMQLLHTNPLYALPGVFMGIFLLIVVLFRLSPKH